jgi:malate synthase
MSDRVRQGELEVARVLYDFINQEALPGTGIAESNFWHGFDSFMRELAPRNAQLLRHRDQLQTQIDAWHRAHPGPKFDPKSYRSFLEQLGYLQSAGEPFAIDTRNVDDEIAVIAGPQLVVPVDNARYALNAANARWGSLYDALYGTDVIPEDDGCTRAGDYNPRRGAKVIAYVRAFLDEHLPLSRGSHIQVSGFGVSNSGLTVKLLDGSSTALRSPDAFAGYQGDSAAPSAVLLKHNGLHVEIRIDRTHLIGRNDSAGICDVVLESAITTIQDCEDSVAAVDAADKVRVYRNWLGLMQGTLSAQFDKGGQMVVPAHCPVAA